MANIQEIKVPDIGDASDVDVIEVWVRPGDSVAKDDSLITLESEKASMEIPSPYSGKILEVKVKEGDKISQDDVIMMIETKEAVKDAKKSSEGKQPKDQQPAASEETQSTRKQTEIVKVPDIGGATDVDVIEVLVSQDQTVKEGDSLITLESDKASMEVPAPFAGTVAKLKVSVGDKVSEGSEILTMFVQAVSEAKAQPQPTETESKTEQMAEPQSPPSPPKPKPEPKKAVEPEVAKSAQVYAGPAVRRLATELGVDLHQLRGSGQKGRIVKEDVHTYVKSKLQAAPSAAQGLQIPAGVKIDFAQFGSIEKKPLNRIKRITGLNVHRSWVSVPQVTQFDEADITDLEAFRKDQLTVTQKQGFKLTLLAFVVKAVVKGLQTYPQFNASLDETGEQLIYKHYYNVGIAVDTPDGLVVPVLRQLDQKGIFDIAKEMGTMSERARNKSLKPQDMQGGCFTISSLGGIGGVFFTPIVNAPDVAILGVSRSSMKQVYQAGTFNPRLMLPLSLSYDHRVIDGAEAARFTGYLAACLSDLRRLLL